MNQSQRKYAMERINQIRDRLIKKAEADNTTPAVSLTPDQRHSLILKGIVKVRKDLSVASCAGYSSHITQIFDFSRHEHPPIVNKEKLNPIVERIQKKAEECCDIIQLGDDMAALKAIAEMELL